MPHSRGRAHQHHEHRGHGHHGEAIEGRHSRNYDRMARLLMRPLYRRIAADIAATAPSGAAVLDIGTGPGLLLAALAGRRPDLRLAGVDIAADMIDHARHNLGEQVELHTADVAALPFKDDRFDLVVSSYSSHHWSDPATGATEIARVLRDEGRFLNYDFPRAPFNAFRPDLTAESHTPFKAGWRGLIMKTTRFEATNRPA